MLNVAEDIETLSFKTPKSRKRLAKILAAKWNYDDVSELMNNLLQSAIDGEFDQDLQRALLRESGGESKKSRKRAVGE